jgi:hypothetical protein
MHDHLQACFEAGLTEAELASYALRYYRETGAPLTRRWRVSTRQVGNSRLVSRPTALKLAQRWGGQ